MQAVQACTILCALQPFVLKESQRCELFVLLPVKSWHAVTNAKKQFLAFQASQYNNAHGLLLNFNDGFRECLPQASKYALRHTCTAMLLKSYHYQQAPVRVLQ